MRLLRSSKQKKKREKTFDTAIQTHGFSLQIWVCYSNISHITLLIWKSMSWRYFIFYSLDKFTTNCGKVHEGGNNMTFNCLGYRLINMHSPHLCCTCPFHSHPLGNRTPPIAWRHYHPQVRKPSWIFQAGLRQSLLLCTVLQHSTSH